MDFGKRKDGGIERMLPVTIQATATNCAKRFSIESFKNVGGESCLPPIKVRL